MAGGIGSRLWPKSRQSKPKQFLDILGSGKTLLRHTYERFASIIDADNFWVVTSRRYRDLVLEQLPELRPEQVLCEPLGRGTATALCYAAHSLFKHDPEAEMVVTPADNYINDVEVFREVIRDSLDFVAKNDALLTVGIKPTRAETGYGYVQASSQERISRAKCFTEKPVLEVAQMFIQSGEFLWNSSIFVWRVQSIIEAIRQHMPEEATHFNLIMGLLGTEEEGSALTRIYSECRVNSIERSIMEHADNVYLHTSDFEWGDIGTWGAINQLQRKDKYGNSNPNDAILFETRNSVISLPNDKIAVVSGLNEYIVVDTEKVLMICPLDEEQNIKKFIDEVNFREADTQS